MKEGDLLYFSILLKFSLVSVYYFNIFRTFLNDGKGKKKGSSLKGTRTETRLPRLQAGGKMSGSWSQSREGQALFSRK